MSQFKKSKREAVVIPGPSGKLEGILSTPSQGLACGLAVICHPHPAHEGTMNNKVVHFLAKTFHDNGFAALRFNFRGVEKSEGQYDGGQGETLDTLVAMSWLQQQYNPNLPLWLAGFSFGGYTSLSAAGQSNIAGLISVAPAIHLFDFITLPHPKCPWLVIQGEKDEVVKYDDVLHWAKQRLPAPELITLPNASHFFHGQLNVLSDHVANFIQAQMKTSMELA